MFKTQLFLIIMDAITAEATTRADAITAEALARTTADGLKTQLFSNTDAITAEATTRQLQ
jgi:hypothetical protein